MRWKDQMNLWQINGFIWSTDGEDLELVFEASINVTALGTTSSACEPVRRWFINTLRECSSAVRRHACRPESAMNLISPQQPLQSPMTHLKHTARVTSYSWRKENKTINFTNFKVWKLFRRQTWDLEGAADRYTYLGRNSCGRFYIRTNERGVRNSTTKVRFPSVRPRSRTDITEATRYHIAKQSFRQLHRCS